MNIRPVSDLRNHFSDISREVKENPEGVVLTKNGYADMVVMSYEAYSRKKMEDEIYQKLMESEIQARTSDVRLSHEEVLSKLHDRLKQYKEADV